MKKEENRISYENIIEYIKELKDNFEYFEKIGIDLRNELDFLEWINNLNRKSNGENQEKDMREYICENILPGKEIDSDEVNTKYLIFNYYLENETVRLSKMAEIREKMITNNKMCEMIKKDIKECELVSWNLEKIQLVNSKEKYKKLIEMKLNDYINYKEESEKILNNFLDKMDTSTDKFKETIDSSADFYKKQSPMGNCTYETKDAYIHYGIRTICANSKCLNSANRILSDDLKILLNMFITCDLSNKSFEQQKEFYDKYGSIMEKIYFCLYQIYCIFEYEQAIKKLKDNDDINTTLGLGKVFTDLLKTPIDPQILGVLNDINIKASECLENKKKKFENDEFNKKYPIFGKLGSGIPRMVRRDYIFFASVDNLPIEYVIGQDGKLTWEIGIEYMDKYNNIIAERETYKEKVSSFEKQKLESESKMQLLENKITELEENKDEMLYASKNGEIKKRGKISKFLFRLFRKKQYNENCKHYDEEIAKLENDLKEENKRIEEYDKSIIQSKESYEICCQNTKSNFEYLNSLKEKIDERLQLVESFNGLSEEDRKNYLKYIDNKVQLDNEFKNYKLALYNYYYRLQQLLKIRNLPSGITEQVRAILEKNNMTVDELKSYDFNNISQDRFLSMDSISEIEFDQDKFEKNVKSFEEINEMYAGINEPVLKDRFLYGDIDMTVDEDTAYEKVTQKVLKK